MGANQQMMMAHSPSTAAFMAATGGTITTDGNYKIHKFTSGGTFTITALPASPSAATLVVGGGGGAG